ARGGRPAGRWVARAGGPRLDLGGECGARGGARRAARVLVRVARVPRPKGPRLGHRPAGGAAAVRRGDRVPVSVWRVRVRGARDPAVVRPRAAAMAPAGGGGDPAGARLLDV